MARNRKRDRLLPRQVLDHFKYEVASELGLTQEINEEGWGNMSSRNCGRVGGRIGGSMVKVMIRQAQRAMSGLEQ